MSIRIKYETIAKEPGEKRADWRSHRYTDVTGLRREETRSYQSQDDTTDYYERRISEDNGKTWGEWFREKKAAKELIGDCELEEGCYSRTRGVYNPVHNHYVTITYQRAYPGGYEKSIHHCWDNGLFDPTHVFLEVSNENGVIGKQMVKYEQGAEYDPENFTKTDYLNTNLGISCSVIVLKCGDILFDMCIPINRICQIAGIDRQKVFPSVPGNGHAPGLMICRGVWNKQENRYDFSFSEPLILDDRQSSRGISEPIIAELPNGKILTVVRASNVIYENWKCRISPYAPCYKFYAISTDGGKSFSPLMPWHFDSREPIHSPATYSEFIKSSKTGKLYWIGNITEPSETFGNFPRFPLHIAEVDEEWGVLKKDTLTVIDTRREGESKMMQLSNFTLFENRETGNYELYLAKLGQYDSRSVYDCESCKYEIIFDE